MTSGKQAVICQSHTLRHTHQHQHLWVFIYFAPVSGVVIIEFTVVTTSTCMLLCVADEAINRSSFLDTGGVGSC